MISASGRLYTVDREKTVPKMTAIELISLHKADFITVNRMKTVPEITETDLITASGRLYTVDREKTVLKMTAIELISLHKADCITVNRMKTVSEITAIETDFITASGRLYAVDRMKTVPKTIGTKLIYLQH